MSNCRFCGESISQVVVDLGSSPLCQSQIAPEQLDQMEPFYPLKALVCENCWLVQLDEFVSPDEIFGEYAYFSSFSDSWVAHAKRYSDKMSAMLELGQSSLVYEIASNDGYLLQHFVAQGVPVVGIEPAANVAQAAIEKGVRSEIEFLGIDTATRLVKKYGKADLVLGNNVLAHVPRLNDFVGGIRILLADDGILTMEFPHLQNLIEQNQFDTIYHEHFSYFSFVAAERVFAHHGIRLFDVEEVPTHGGSLRIFGCHDQNTDRATSERVAELRARELKLGYETTEIYSDFQSDVQRTKRNLLTFLIDAKNSGKTVVGYGAPGKGNTLLNYCGIRTDFLDYTVDRNPYKQGAYTPGSRIPIMAPEEIKKTRPDYILILPWNLAREIADQNKYVDLWGGKFVVPIPTLTILD
jgi:SAM-dependent methyltransferase